MKRIGTFFLILICMTTFLNRISYAENKKINPKRLFAIAEKWIGHDEKAVGEKIMSIGYSEDKSIPVLNGHMYYKDKAALDHIVIGYDAENKKVNSIGFSFKADPDIFLEIYESNEENIGNAQYSATSISWETDEITYELTASFLEQSDTTISLFEIQLGKRDFVLYANKKQNVNISKTNKESSKKTSTPTATPKPIVSKISILSATINRNRFGTYELYVSFKNNESNNVDRIDFRVKCFDAYGNQCKAYNYYDITELCYDLTIRANGISDRDLYWRLSGYSDVKAVEIAVIKYHTTDGRTIEIPDYDLKWYKF